LDRLLFAPRSLRCLVAVSFALGAAYALTMLSADFIAGTSSFWQFPAGTILGAQNDMAECLVGYLYLVKSPWSWPILYVAKLGIPFGTNVFWLDVVPWLSLVGKIVFSLFGVAVNLLGVYVFACLALPGVAMTALLAVLGQRGLLAAIAGTAIAETTPYLLYRWGHTALLAQFWIIAGLALYAATMRHPSNRRVAVAWSALLVVSFLNAIYLFVMVGIIWTAGLLQRLLDRSVSRKRLLLEFVAPTGIVVCLAIVTGILSPQLGAAPSRDFGRFSLNLAGPFVPQMSGVIPWLSDYRVGMKDQYEGFAWVGLGVLLLCVTSLPAWIVWARHNGRRHLMLLCAFAALFLFALSNKVYVGSHPLVAIPLPRTVLDMLGAFRASGRFFWPIGYALAAGSILLTLRSYRPAVGFGILSLACALQVLDVEPLRQAIAATTGRPTAPSIDRERRESLIARASSVELFPSTGCADQLRQERMISLPESIRLGQANEEVQLAAARLARPINTVYMSRILRDCYDDDALEQTSLRDGVLYIYMTSYTPAQAQLGNHSADDVCSTLDSLYYCLMPAN
jgi:hypothetical protein